MSAQGTRRHSWEILADLCSTVTVKALAYQLRLTGSLVYEWCKEPDEDLELSNRRNPLDRTREIISLAIHHGRTDLASEILNWLAAERESVIASDDEITAIEKILDGMKRRARKSGQ